MTQRFRLFLAENVIQLEEMQYLLNIKILTSLQNLYKSPLFIFIFVCISITNGSSLNSIENQPSPQPATSTEADVVSAQNPPDIHSETSQSSDTAQLSVPSPKVGDLAVMNSPKKQIIEDGKVSTLRNIGFAFKEYEASLTLMNCKSTSTLKQCLLVD